MRRVADLRFGGFQVETQRSEILRISQVACLWFLVLRIYTGSMSNGKIAKWEILRNTTQTARNTNKEKEKMKILYTKVRCALISKINFPKF